MTIPRGPLRYGDLRDLELARRDEERCERFWARLRNWWQPAIWKPISDRHEETVK